LTSREKILEAASEILRKSGPGALSVRAISKSAGMSTIGIYNHFDGKRGVIDELAKEAFDLVHQAIVHASRIEDARAAVLKAAQNYLAVARDHEAHYRLVFGEAVPGYAMGPKARVAARRAFNRLVELVDAASISNEFLSDARANAIHLWTIIHGYISLKHHAVPMILNEADWENQIIQIIAHQINHN